MRLKTIGLFALLTIMMAGGGYLAGTMSENSSVGGAMNVRNAPQASGIKTSIVAALSTAPAKEYVGHVKAIQDVDIYAQISGVVQDVHFKEGGLVKQGDLLFTIDPREYEAEVRVQEASVLQAQASLESDKADLHYAEAYLKRLKNADSRSVVQADVDKADAALLSGQAKVHKANAEYEQAKANLEVARINLDYTQVRAPIDGKIGKAELTRGDYVSPGSGKLAQIVQIDPIRVQFSLSDKEYFNQVKVGDADLQNILLKLPNGDEYPVHGIFDFWGNKMNLGTGTMTANVQFENADGVLVPDSYVTVLMKSSSDSTSPAIPQLSVMTDTAGEYVYVLNDKGAIEKRSVELGDLVGEKRIILSGLALGEQVVVNGLQKVQVGQKVGTNVPSNSKDK